MKKKYQRTASRLPKWPQKKLQHELQKLFEKSGSKRLNAKQIAKKLQIANSKDSINAAISKLEKSGAVRFVKDGKFASIKGVHPQKQTYEGVVDLTSSGAAYIIVEGLERDIYVPAKRTRRALDKDRVKVAIRGVYRNRLEGEIVDIVQRATNQFVALYQKSKNYGFAIPTDHRVPFDIFIHPEQKVAAEDKQYVLVEIVEWPKRHTQNPVGKIIQVFDMNDVQELTMQSILAENGFKESFDEEILKAAADLPKDITEADVAERRDFRDICTFTIDPLTAKDFDDALSIRQLENGEIEVGVHIADVTHYVQPGSIIDKEAYKRSTSVYLVDRVAPMLPEELSNALCSLRPHEESLTFSAVFTFDPTDYELKTEWFGRTIIYSDHRYTYEDAQAELDSETGHYPNELKLLNRIAHKLRKDRYGDGSISFESQELYFILDDQNDPVDVKPKLRQDTNLLIEDFMLLANRRVAKYIGDRKNEQPIPFVYRIHDTPDRKKLDDFAALAKELDFKVDFSTPDKVVQTLNRLHESAQHDAGLKVLDQLAIRAMAKAEYNPDNIGHFGLGFDFYAHFTSPIRRYADVLVHRILAKNLSGNFRADLVRLTEQCEHISLQERKAIDAERKSIKWMQVKYISKFVGQTFKGVVNGIIERGIFVELVENLCEGMISFDRLPEPYTLSDNRLKARGMHTGNVIRLGSRVTVKVIDANLDKKQIELDWVTEEA